MSRARFSVAFLLLGCSVSRLVSQTAPIPSPPAPRASQAAVSAPRVTFKNGLLAIHADHATLIDVLTAVRRATGATLEVPPALGSERIVVDLGPGPANEVMAKLLEGSRFDYVIAQNPSEPQALQSVTLWEKPSGAPGASGGAPVTQPAPLPPEPLPVEVPEVEDTPPSPPPDISEMPNPPSQPQEQPAQDANNPNPTKTPEQLLEELRRLQQQGQAPQPGAQPQLMDTNPVPH